MKEMAPESQLPKNNPTNAMNLGASKPQSTMINLLPLLQHYINITNANMTKHDINITSTSTSPMPTVFGDPLPFDQRGELSSAQLRQHRSAPPCSTGTGKLGEGIEVNQRRYLATVTPPGPAAQPAAQLRSSTNGSTLVFLPLKFHGV